MAIDPEHAQVVLERGGERVLSLAWAARNCRVVSPSSVKTTSPLMHLPKAKRSGKPAEDSKVRQEWRLIPNGGVCSKCFRTHAPLFVSGGVALCSFCRDARRDKSRDALDTAILAGAFDSNRRRH